jgi:hypothetical protein
MLRSRESVIDFTQRVGIHVAIVVGRSRFDRLIEHNSKLKIHLDLASKNK